MTVTVIPEAAHYTTTVARPALVPHDRHLRICEKVWAPAQRLAPHLFGVLVAAVWRAEPDGWTDVPVAWIGERTRREARRIRADLAVISQTTGLVEIDERAARGRVRYRVTQGTVSPPPHHGATSWWTPLSYNVWQAALEDDSPVTIADIQDWVLRVAPLVRDRWYQISTRQLARRWRLNPRTVARVMDRMQSFGWISWTRDGPTSARQWAHWQTAQMPPAEVPTETIADDDCPPDADAHREAGNCAVTAPKDPTFLPPGVVHFPGLAWCTSRAFEPTAPYIAFDKELLTPSDSLLSEVSLHRAETENSGGDAASTMKSKSRSAGRRAEFDAGAVLWRSSPEIRAAIRALPDQKFRWPIRSCLAAWIRRACTVTHLTIDQITDQTETALRKRLHRPPDEQNPAGLRRAVADLAKNWYTILDQTMRALITDARVGEPSTTVTNTNPIPSPPLRWREKITLPNSTTRKPRTVTIPTMQSPHPLTETPTEYSQTATKTLKLLDQTDSSNVWRTIRALRTIADKTAGGEHIHAALDLWVQRTPRFDPRDRNSTT